MRFLPFLILTFLLTANAAWSAVQITKTVEGKNGLSCIAYLNINDGSTRPLPLIVSVAGTGVYSNGAAPDQSSPEGYLFISGKVNVLTIDKPGIQYSSSDPGYTLDDKVYSQYTQETLITCLQNALTWALQNDRVGPGVFLMGHSEGAQVVTRVYSLLLQNNSTVAAQIRALFLSGIPMDGWKDIINWQMRDCDSVRQDFWKAIQTKDTAALRKVGNLGHPYWEEILRTEPLRQTMERLATMTPSASFQFYHGLKDQNTRVDAVTDFETWNRARTIEGKPALRLAARYYNAEHYLNLAAMNDMIFNILARLD
ncbi:MAG TPA: hypothetical protein VJB59_03845 [Bdellovibrionota bacterium]|nr:hypothetical protein [Bdellovibrionota bacterium]